MSKQTLVFIKDRSEVNNTIDATSPLGEMSTHTQTFSKDIREHTAENYDDLSLMVLSNTVDGSEVSIDAGIKNTIFVLFARAISFVAATTGPVSISDMKNFIFEISTVTNLEIGPIVDDDTGGRGPEFISFRTSDQVPTDVTIWYSDEALKDQYPLISVVPVGTLPDITQLRNSYANLVDLDAQVSTEETFERIESIKNDHPYTQLIPFNTVIHALDDSSKTIDFLWYVLTYGPHGSHQGLIRNAIIQLIEELDPDNIQEWRDAVAPELFNATEFYIFPNWGNVAIPNLTDAEGYYSPIQNTEAALADALIALPEYNATQIKEMSETFTSHYKSIGLTAISGFGNEEGKRNLSDIVPSYIPVATTDPDFVRMTTHAQDFSRFLTDLLTSAEDRYADRDVDTDIREVVRDGVEYFIATYDHVEYLVKLKPGE